MHVPPAAKCAEGAHCSASRIRSSALHVISRNKELPIRVQNVGQRNCAGLVGALRKIPSSRKRGNFTLQLLPMRSARSDPTSVSIAISLALPICLFLLSAQFESKKLNASFRGSNQPVWPGSSSPAIARSGTGLEKEPSESYEQQAAESASSAQL